MHKNSPQKQELPSEVTQKEMSSRILINSRTSKRAIICFYCALGKTITETHHDLVAVYGEDAPALSVIHRWFQRHRAGRVDFWKTIHGQEGHLQKDWMH